MRRPGTRLDVHPIHVSLRLVIVFGVEAFLGPIGLRAEVGDEIIFVGVAHHNW